MDGKKTFWLSYDLGLQGDYPSLYRWLDKNNAKECGDSLAVFQYECKGDDPTEEIKKDLEQNVAFGKTDRIYLIWRDDSKKLNKGKFIVGNRKQAPWEGYFLSDAEQDTDY